MLRTHNKRIRALQTKVVAGRWAVTGKLCGWAEDRRNQPRGHRAPPRQPAPSAATEITPLKISASLQRRVALGVGTHQGPGRPKRVNARTRSDGDLATGGPVQNLTFHPLAKHLLHGHVPAQYSAPCASLLEMDHNQSPRGIRKRHHPLHEACQHPVSCYGTLFLSKGNRDISARTMDLFPTSTRS